MSRAIVYIDGFNLYYGALKGTPYKWLDVVALARRLVPNDRLGAVRYFTARVRPHPGDPQQPQRQQAYLRALGALPLVTIHLGHYLSHVTRMPLADPRPGGPRTVEVIKTEEKGSNVTWPRTCSSTLSGGVATRPRSSRMTRICRSPFGWPRTNSASRSWS
jgi:hypothetical protein